MLLGYVNAILQSEDKLLEKYAYIYDSELLKINI